MLSGCRSGNSPAGRLHPGYVPSDGAEHCARRRRLISGDRTLILRKWRPKHERATPGRGRAKCLGSSARGAVEDRVSIRAAISRPMFCRPSAPAQEAHLADMIGGRPLASLPARAALRHQRKGTRHGGLLCCARRTAGVHGRRLARLSAWPPCCRALQSSLDADRSSAGALACEPHKGRLRQRPSVARARASGAAALTGDEPVCVRDRGRNASNNRVVRMGPANRSRCRL